MARRGHDCRCCNPPYSCSGCPDDSSITLAASVEYPAGAGVVLPAGKFLFQNKTVTWTDVSTKCQAKADDVSITRVVVTKQGTGYTSLPTLSFTGGGGTVSAASMDVAFETKSITLTSGGSGYFEVPTVGPGIIDAQVRGKIVSLSLTDAGEGYEEPPTITFSGGTGATAVATIDELGKVATLQLTGGGSNYPPSPTVRFDGGNPTRPAQATSKISGSVESLTLLRKQEYVLQRRIGSASSSPLSSSLLFQGACDTPATGKVEWEGRVLGITVTDSGGYTSEPSIKIEDGGGAGATANAEISWEQKHERTAPVSLCYAQVSGSHFYETTADQYPDYIQAYQGISEASYWSVDVSTDTQQTRMIGAINGVFPSVLNDSLLNHAWFFRGEAIWVRSFRSWGAFSPRLLTQGCPGFSGGSFSQTGAYEAEENVFFRRRFSRVAPSQSWQIVSPEQPPTATQAILHGTYRQYVDLKSDSVWYLEELTLAQAGQNLYLAGPSSVVKFRPLNSTQEISLTVQASFSQPQTEQEAISGFTAQPVVVVVWQVIPGGNGSRYRAASVSAPLGGFTTLPNQQISFSLRLAAGHAEDMPRFIGQIVNGRLASVAVANAGVVCGPSTITSIGELSPDPLMSRPERFVSGESGYVVTLSHSAPTVTGHADMTSEFMDAGEFSVTLQSATDLNGMTFWKVSQLQVVRQPSGTLASADVIFETDETSIAAISAIARIAAESRDAPDGSLLQSFDNGVVFENFTLEEQADECGDEFWRITAAELSNAASQRVGFQVNDTLPVLPIGLAVTMGEAGEVTVTAVDNDGRITGFDVTKGGKYWEERPGINVSRFWVIDGGKYFRRTLAETNTKLPTYSSCLGPVSVQSGWSLNRMQLINPSVFQVDIGQQYGNNPAPRVRRCSMPTISNIELR